MSHLNGISRTYSIEIYVTLVKPILSVTYKLIVY